MRRVSAATVYKHQADTTLKSTRILAMSTDQDTFPYLSLFPATPEQELVYVHRAGEQWGVPNGLSIDEFAAGNAALSVSSI
ncbi:hypothetical protein CYLTODRAFT_420931 [Cylindrobasidium torrendii FP15055 ss-10]|uniref:Uncharacterized protein n=1 Tax=Cylindrobasidium torrendii FP15055 ss-10 TaxID=1314674 RepID=A0A0D7BFE5_9AGAR|nr:hypothetical protein CYLTODRAFT_420931 [Cylindrobasidium torrendii FP15055 ss-10]